MSITVCNFPNIGFLKINLNQEQMAPILQEVTEIKENFLLVERANKFLVGNIKKEFELTKSHKHIELLLQDYVQHYEDNFKFMSKITVLSENRPLYLDKLWVNFQEKHEFNPVHDHTGVFSFVIWVKIPYNLKNETALSPGVDSAQPLAGHFSFYYTNTLGNLCHFSIPADETMENTLLIFPSKLNHSVYPFYSSEDFRISVSGNVAFQV